MCTINENVALKIGAFKLLISTPKNENFERIQIRTTYILFQSDNR